MQDVDARGHMPSNMVNYQFSETQRLRAVQKTALMHSTVQRSVCVRVICDRDVTLMIRHYIFFVVLI